MTARCRISQPPNGGIPSLTCSTGELEGVASPSEGVYHVSLATGYALAPHVGLQVSGTNPNIIVGAELEQAPDGTYYIAVFRTYGGQPQNGDVWLLVAGIEEI